MIDLFKERTGAAILPMVLVITALVGSYHFYNKGVSKTSSEILASSRVSTAQGDAFAYNAVNRLVNLIKIKGEGCYGDSTDEAFIERLKTFAKSFAGSESDLEDKLEFGYISGGDSDEDAVTCIASSEELSGIKDFKVRLKAQRFNSCSNAIKISVKGRTQSTGDGNTEVEFKNQAKINVSFLKNLEFAVNFSGNDAHIESDQDSILEFEAPVFVGSNSGNDETDLLNVKDLISDDDGLAWGGYGSAVFSEGLISSKASVTYDDDVPDDERTPSKVWNFGVLQEIFPEGIRLNTGLKKEQLSKVMNGLKKLALRARRPSKRSPITWNCDGTQRIKEESMEFFTSLELGSDSPDKSVCVIGGGLGMGYDIIVLGGEEHTLYMNVLTAGLVVHGAANVKIRHLRDAPEIDSFLQKPGVADLYSFNNEFFKAPVKHAQECGDEIGNIDYDESHVYYVR